MIPIRIKVILLALLAVLSLAALLTHEYRDREQHLDNAKAVLQAVDRVAHFSQLVHCLQRERGLTAVVLVEKRATARQELLLERNCSREAFAQAPLTSVNALGDFDNTLTAFRDRVDATDADWPEAQTFYTARIKALLQDMALSLVGLSTNVEVNHLLHAIVSLSLAREHLGLVRANTARMLEQGRFLPQEFLTIHLRYNQFEDALRAFETHLAGADHADWVTSQDQEHLAEVRSLIQELIRLQRLPLPVETDGWWRLATELIDSLKTTEDRLLAGLVARNRQDVKAAHAGLFGATILALGLFALIVLLTALTIARILNALGILAKVLHEIQKTHDFGLRIKTRGHDEFGELSLSINDLLDFTDHVVREKEALAATDALTGLPNRRRLHQQALAEAKRSRRYDSPLAVILCDIDQFKTINDQHGHPVGDQVLQAFAHVVRKHIRDSDTAARWGGEEFVILAPETSAAAAVELAEHLRRELSQCGVGQVPSIHCSFGVAALGSTETLEQLFERADAALYRAKNTGRNRVCLAPAPEPSNAMT